MTIVRECPQAVLRTVEKEKVLFYHNKKIRICKLRTKIHCSSWLVHFNSACTLFLALSHVQVKHALLSHTSVHLCLPMSGVLLSHHLLGGPLLILELSSPQQRLVGPCPVRAQDGPSVWSLRQSASLYNRSPPTGCVLSG